MRSLFNHPAFKQLDEGSVQLKLGMQSEITKELIKYLIVKRALLSGDARSQATAYTMYPTIHMDRLWCWMLLNTHVRDEVHKLVGGDVPHTTDTNSDPHLELHRHDVAQTAMESFGFTPNPCVWGFKRSPVSDQPKVQIANPVDINVTIITLTGQSKTYSISNGITIAELKLLVQRKDGTPPDQQRFLYAGIQMEDDMPVDHYTQDAKEVVIHLFLKLRGC